MASVEDVAAYILHKRGSTTALKLQKLVYYCQAWSLVWDDAPLFTAKIQAWANGPVVPKLYRLHRGEYLVKKLPKGNPDALTAKERETVDAVLQYYGDFPAQQLVSLTHSEEPWLRARRGLAPLQKGNVEITRASMVEYYSSLAASQS